MNQIGLISNGAVQLKQAPTQLQTIASIASVVSGCPVVVIRGKGMKYERYLATCGVEQVAPGLLTDLRILNSGIFNFVEIQDTHGIEELRDHPDVKGSPFIRFVAALPILSRKGEIGDLFVVSPSPGKFSDKQKESLIALAELASFIMEQGIFLSELESSSQFYFRQYSTFFCYMNQGLRSMLNSIRGSVSLLIQDKPSRHQLLYLNTLRERTNNFVDVLDKVMQFDEPTVLNMDAANQNEEEFSVATNKLGINRHAFTLQATGKVA